MESVDWDAYDVVGFTTTFAQNVASLALARRVKERSPESVVVFGGANCEGEMGLALHRSFPFVDLVCAGEADLTFPRLLTALRDGGDPAEIPGVVARRAGDSVYSSLSPQRVHDLDELPYPDFDDFFEQAGAERRRVVVMETARGCWWGDKHHCGFCGIDFPEKYRSKSPERALAELLALRDAYDAQAFVMTDEILDMRYFRDFIPRLAELEEPVTIFYETKANLTKAQLQLLAGAGIRQIQPGIESFSSRVLGLVDKGVSAVQNVQLLKWCEELGIEARWNILYGVPAGGAGRLRNRGRDGRRRPPPLPAAGVRPRQARPLQPLLRRSGGVRARERPAQPPRTGSCTTCRSRPWPVSPTTSTSTSPTAVIRPAIRPLCARGSHGGVPGTGREASSTLTTARR